MATLDFDTVVHVYNSSQDKRIGQTSAYVDTPHPGTNKKIEGWNWDDRIWASLEEFRAVAYAPSIWDPAVSGLNEDYYQSGYGDNKDLLLLGIEEVYTNEADIWAPRVNHGYFYSRDIEWYLYSDSHMTQYFTISGVEDGRMFVQLEKQYKPTIPVLVRSFRFNRELARHEIYRDFRKKVEFSSSPETAEFIVDTTSGIPPRIILDRIYDEEIGELVTLDVSGFADSTKVLGLDIVGLSDGLDNQEFSLLYSPVDSDSPVQILSWVDASYPDEWDIIDPLEDFVSGERQVKLDYDRGLLTFGEVGTSIIPPGGHRIGAHYTVGTSVMYEPENTQDDVLAYGDNANINPIISGTSRGFVQVSVDSPEPDSIQLTSDLTLTVDTYDIQLGNNVGKIIALVKGVGGNTLEGQEVTFEILDPKVGSFGTVATTANAITDSAGEAFTYYNSPPTVQGLGVATTTVTHDGGNTIVTVEGVVEPADVSDIYIFKVHTSDEALGIPASGLNTYYTDYLSDEGITEGAQGTVEFEQDFRAVHDLLVPPTYGASDLTTGKKTIMLTTRSGTMNPHTGSIEAGIFVPLVPSTIENIGTVAEPILKMTYTGVEIDLPGTNGTRSYFVVGASKTQIRGYVTNSRTNKKIYSNTITLEISIPDLVNGTYFCSVLNDIPDGTLTVPVDVDTLSSGLIIQTSGYNTNWQDYLDEKFPSSEGYVEWFRRTKRGDTVGLNDMAENIPLPLLSGLNIVDALDCPSEIPLGFRLKSIGVTIASVIDQVTYLDPNDYLASGYFEG